jgi:hypothetical protein
LKSGFYSRDEVLAPSDCPSRPSSWATTFSLQQITTKALSEGHEEDAVEVDDPFCGAVERESSPR